MKINHSEMPAPRSVAISPKDRFLRRFIEWGILGLIIFSPLPAASVYEWCLLVIQGVVLLMVLGYLMIGRKSLPKLTPLDNFRWPRRLWTAFFVFLVVQLIPLPVFLVRILSPKLVAFRTQLSGADPVRFMTLSAIPHRTIHDGLYLFCCLLLGFLIIRTVTTRRQIKRVFVIIVGVGVFEAIYGLFELTHNSPRILFYAKEYDLGSVTGTFVNRNHLSGYLEMVIPLAIGLIISRIDLFEMAGRRVRDRLLLLAEKGLAVNVVISFGVIVMALAVVYSRSRSGIFLMVLGLLLILGLTALFFGHLPQQRSWKSVTLRAVFTAIVLIALVSGIGSTLERFSRENILEEGRLSVWGKTLEIVKDFPLTGSGLGTFAQVFMAYNDEGGDVRFSHVHNDYLEYLSELGVVGFALLAGGVLSLLIFCYKRWKTTEEFPNVKGLGLGGLVAVLLALVHNLTDFNLHIPANMLLFTVVLSITVVTVRYKQSSRNSNLNEETRP